MLNNHVALRRQGQVYVLEEAGTIDYSDGSDVEHYLKTVLENAQDLSSYSVELEQAARDWPSEYHLSSKRANLLRAFNFERCTNVLELGCGCGAISRFLGEQGLAVDAVEGSYARAELAALRCRDLDNVLVYCGNFNNLDLPDEAYDLICLIGVTEYAARFMDGQGRVNPVVALLKRLKRAVKPGGIVAVAIENRTGMKYLLGAHEDHYARRFMGINNYFGAWDINTYTLPEWEGMFEQSGVRGSKLYLPFPDYKLPTVILSGQFAADNPEVFCNLEGVQSRDYVDVFRPEVSESLLWQGAAASRSLDLYANSFLFLLDMTGTGIDSGYDFDFAHLPGFSRRRECCLITVKPVGEDMVRRRKLVDHKFDCPHVRQIVRDEPYRRGTLLSVLWSRALLIEPETDRFIDLVKEYVAFVIDRGEVSIDLMPSNIIVGPDGTYYPFDEEWSTIEPVSAGFLLFRALVVLAVTATSSLRPYARLKGIETVREFIMHAGDHAGMMLGPAIDEYVEYEEKFQNSIAVERLGNLTREFLNKSVKEDPRHVAPVWARVYWKKTGEHYSEQDSRRVLVDNSDDVQTVTLLLPASAGAADWIRFNPGEQVRDDGVGCLRIYRIGLTAIDTVDNTRTPIWSITEADEIAEFATLTGIEYISTSLGSVFMVTGDDPDLDFELIPRTELGQTQRLELEVELSFARSPEYLLARDRYVTTRKRLEERLREVDELEAACRRANKQLAAVKNEVSDIKNSYSWRVTQPYRSWRTALNGFKDGLAWWTVLPGKIGWRQTAAYAYRRGSDYVMATIGRVPEVEGPPTRYEQWWEQRMILPTRAPVNSPLISVIMPVHNVSGEVLAKAVKSVKRQSYGNWELCIADDASTNRETLAVLEKVKGKRIKVVNLPENLNISGATNAAVELATGEYLAFMDNDDELADNALSEVARAIGETGADCVYTDEDFIKVDGHLDYPHFKPDYNPDLLLSHNYITHLLVVKRELFHRVGKLRTEYDGAQDYDLTLRVVEQASRVVHIPKPLYHWRMSEQSTSLNPVIKPEGHNNARSALEDALRRRNIQGAVEETRLPHYFRVRRAVSGAPKLSIIVPFRDKPGLLRKCMKTVVERTEYRDFELIGISNESQLAATYDEMESLRRLDDRICFHELNEDFNFSKLVNYGVARSTGEHVLLLNNDIEVINPDWIQGLLEHSQRGDVAAVGGKLYYPNNTIQHAGIAVGLGGYAGHLHQRFRADAPGYFNRLNVIQNISAVTGAMMMVEKKKYMELGMFDEQNFGIAYNDVDFCLRAMEAGYLNVFTPYVEAYHHESASRGYEDTPDKKDRFEREKANLLARYGETIRKGDPYYNPNFDQNRDDFRFSINPAFAEKV